MPPLPPELLARDLAPLVRGEVAVDRFTRHLYATDASIYRIVPLGVVHPLDEADVVAVVEFAARRGVPVLPRGAGTSLAGQTVGEALVLDFTTHMNRILEVDAGARRVRVQPGCVLDTLNRTLATHGLFFAIDPASGSRATIGGMIGNNSSGPRSLVYGTTSDHLRRARVVVAAGEAIDVGVEAAVSPGSRVSSLMERVRELALARASEISARYPDLGRNVTGYDLRRAVRAGDVDLSRLLAGSEGTLGAITEAVMALEPLPAARGLVVLGFESLQAACESVPGILAHQPAACELLDGMMLSLARRSPLHARAASRIPDATGAILYVELHGESARTLDGPMSALETDVARHLLVSTLDPVLQGELWAFRKSGLGILMSRAGDRKPIAFIEDCAVPPAVLAEYVAFCERVVAEEGTEAGFYGHAGPGVIHVRPLISTKEPADVERMHRIARRIVEWVIERGGAPSGEHGDGLARTQWVGALYGPEIGGAFREVKAAFDPAGIFNPGKIVAEGADLRKNLRYGPGYEPVPPDTVVEFRREGGLVEAVEMCNGSGECRVRSTGVMCPTFRADPREILTTRGRANLMRDALSGALGEDALFATDFKEQVMDLCIGCKGCKHDCPTQVDFAAIKMAWKEAWHARFGVTLRELFFGYIDRVLAVARRVPGSGKAMRSSLSRFLVHRLLGIHEDRSLPRVAARTFRAWFARHRRLESGPADVVYFADCAMDACEPEVGAAAVHVLEQAGYRVHVPRVVCCGRPAFSQGLVRRGMDLAGENVRRLSPWLARGWTIVGTEPSCVHCIRDDYPDLVGPAARLLASRTADVLAFLEVAGLGSAAQRGPRAVLHGHCHQKAGGGLAPVARFLRRLGDVEVLDSTCCGMAGSFGYEAEHQALSMAIGADLAGRIRSAGPGILLAPGASCRAQLRDLGFDPLHPVVHVARTAGGRPRASDLGLRG